MDYFHTLPLIIHTFTFCHFLNVVLFSIHTFLTFVFYILLYSFVLLNVLRPPPLWPLPSLLTPLEEARVRASQA